MAESQSGLVAVRLHDPDRANEIKLIKDYQRKNQAYQRFRKKMASKLTLLLLFKS